MPREATAASAPPEPAEPQPIDVNMASFEALSALPGVGPIAARRLLDLRAERGRIDGFDEFCDVVQPTRRVREQLEERVEFGRGVEVVRTPNPEHVDPDDPYGGRQVDV